VEKYIYCIIEVYDNNTLLKKMCIHFITIVKYTEEYTTTELLFYSQIVNIKYVFS